MSRPAAVLFDCDGTLADTERAATEAWRRVLADRGVVPTDADFAAIIGHAWPVSFDHFAARVDLGDPDEFRAELRAAAAAIHGSGLRLFADTVATVRQLAAEGVPLAVVSSSSRAHVLRCLDRGRLGPLIGAVVGADDVTRHKPDPEPYLSAAAHLGVDPAGCTVVEDTAIGLASAKAAGTFTVAVARGAVPLSDLAAADRIVEEVTVPAVAPPAGRSSRP